MKHKPLIRVTQLEKFRRLICDVSSYDTEQSVIDTICGDFRGNEYTRIGTAFHSIVETGEPHNADPNEGCVIDVDDHGVRFNASQLQIALDYSDEHPGAFHEIRRYRDYGEAVVTGCADMIDGLEIRDIKTKYSTPSDSDYTDSCQWRYYLDIFGLDVFHFDLFVFEGYKPEKHGYDVRGLNLYRHTPPITCYRYPEMEGHNQDLLHEFLEWAEKRNLLGRLPTASGTRSDMKID